MDQLTETVINAFIEKCAAEGVPLEVAADGLDLMLLESLPVTDAYLSGFNSALNDPTVPQEIKKKASELMNTPVFRLEWLHRLAGTA